MEELRILTWHVHGSYLYYLSQSGHQFFLPVRSPAEPGFGGRGESFALGDNVREVPAEQVRELDFDCILYQSPRNYLRDQFEVLSERQQRLPRIYLEHDPPREHPTDTRHPVEDPDVLVVHVTDFNRLMWDNGGNPTRVIEHGVLIPQGVAYSGELPRGLVAVNNLASRGRRLGLDVFESARRQVPLDLVGLGAAEAGGLGEVPPMRFAEFAARYRFYFSPIRYTSLGLATCEAMAIGLPVVGLATTELVSVVENGVNGYLSLDVDELVEAMQDLLRDPQKARRLGAAAREYARSRFGIERFVADWDDAFQEAVSRQAAVRTAEVSAP